VLWWDTDLVENVIEEDVKRWKIDTFITFDDGGVSGHINHRAVAAGVRYLHPNSLLSVLGDHDLTRKTLYPGESLDTSRCLPSNINLCPPQVHRPPRLTDPPPALSPAVPKGFVFNGGR
jgi:hypothetical protein